MSVFFRRQSFAQVTIDKSKDCFLVASASTKTTAERQQRLHCGYSPVRIDGPYALGVMAAPYYLALSTVVFPIAVGRFPLLIAQCERGETDEA